MYPEKGCQLRFFRRILDYSELKRAILSLSYYYSKVFEVFPWE